MKEYTIISGKGGTGKTTFVANIAAIADKAVLADCDVDAPNLHLLLKPQINNTKVYTGSQVVAKDEKKCIECGKCREVCNFAAITAEYKINQLKCDGCAVCVAFCPTNALTMKEEETGNIFISNCEYGPMVHARLKAGADNSGKLVSEVRKLAVDIARDDKKDLILIDGSPGIGCPVIASLNGVDGALVVTEPTRTGLSDLKRILEVCKYFEVAAMVIINKYDINQKMTKKIKEYCEHNDILVPGQIPFDMAVNDYLREGKLLVKESMSEASQAIQKIWNQILEKEMV